MGIIYLDEYKKRKEMKNKELTNIITDSFINRMFFSDLIEVLEKNKKE